MYVAVIIATLLPFHSILCQDLYNSPKDITLTIHEVEHFSVSLKEAVEDDVHLRYYFSTQEFPVVNISATDLTIPSNSTSALNFTIYPIEAGKTTILIDANTSTGINIDTQDAFTRVSVIYYHSLEIISSVIGWIYFVAWSVSFYPQAYSNFKRKSVVGLNFDFLALNITGFLAYSFFNLGLYFSPVVQEEYLSNHRGGVIPVEINDVVFGVHAAFASLLQIVQCFIYQRDDQKVSKTAKIILSVIWVAGVIFLVVTWTGVNKYQPWLTFLYYFSYCKLGITIIKYIPQAYFNFRRKSTVGWSIGNILLDFTGGLLSMMQMFVIAYNYNDWESLFGNPTKFGLGFFSILFDVLFMVQHYCLYKRHNKELDPLCESA